MTRPANRLRVGGTWARTGLPPALTSASYDAANRHLSFGGQVLTYDLNGNLLSDGTSGYTWDARNRVTGVTGPITATFQYDATGRRTRKTVNGVTTDFVHDGINPVTESSAGGTGLLLTGLAIDNFMLRIGPVTTSMFLTDALGSLVATTDSAGGVQSQVTYEPFGATEISSPAPAYRFTGREHDEPMYLYYYRARYYHTDLQRFISEDPIGFAGGDFNVYAYVRNRPTRFVDPKGLQQLQLTDPVFGPGNANECIPRCTQFGDPINLDPATRAAADRRFYDFLLEFGMGRIRAVEKGMPPGCCFGPPPVEAAPPAAEVPSPSSTAVPPSEPTGGVLPPSRTKTGG